MAAFAFLCDRLASAGLNAVEGDNSQPILTYQLSSSINQASGRADKP